MKTLARVKTATTPEIFKLLPSGGYTYKFDVQEHTDRNGEVYWSYVPIYMRKVSKTPVYKDLVSAIIRQYLTVDEEFDLINSFNAGEDIEEYQAYVKLLKHIKTTVKADLKNHKL